MLKKRTSLVLAAMFVLALLLSFSATVFAAGPSISVTANFGGSNTGYGYVNGYLNLNITLGGATGVSNPSVSLALPGTVSFSRVISGGSNNGNVITPTGSTIVVELYCSRESTTARSTLYSQLCYKADSIGVTYSAADATGTASASAYVDIGVRKNSSDNTPVLPSSLSTYPGTTYPGSTWTGNNPYYYGRYPYTTNPSNVIYGTYGYYINGSYYQYGTSYNGVYYYNNQTGSSCYGTAYDPYAQLNNFYGLSFDTSNLTLGVGKSYQLNVKVGAYGSTYGINWSSSNAQVAAVDSNGLVTGLSQGNATITARSTYGTTATCNVTVGNAAAVSSGTAVVPSVSSEVKSLSFAKVKTKLSVGEVVQMYVNIKPSDIDYGNTQIVSSDTSVVQALEGGLVQAVGTGTATVYFSFGGKTALCTFTVK